MRGPPLGATTPTHLRRAKRARGAELLMTNRQAASPEAAFDEIVEPARVEFEEAEHRLTAAVAGGPGAPDLEAARALVLRRARAAVVELHQFVDRVHAARPSWAPAGSLPELRASLQRDHCRFLRGTEPVDDVDLLHDLADAFKHVSLDRPTKGRERVVTHEGAVVRLATGYGDLAFGEGKFGGVEQLIVERVDGRQRAVSSVLLNVSDAWAKAMGRTLEA